MSAAATRSDPAAVESDGSRLRVQGSADVALTVADTPARRLRAWRLTYLQYRRAGLVDERRDGLWFGAYDLLPGTRSLVASVDGCERATLTVVADDPSAGLPADALYRDELGALRKQGYRLQEVTSLAIDEEEPRLGLERFFLLWRGSVAIAAAHRRNGVAITVHPRHASFYIRSLRFTQIGPERSYAKVSGAPAVLLLQDLRDAARRFADQPPGCPPALWRALRDRAQGDELARFFARPAPHRPIHQESP